MHVLPALGSRNSTRDLPLLKRAQLGGNATKTVNKASHGAERVLKKAIQVGSHRHYACTIKVHPSHSRRSRNPTTSRGLLERLIEAARLKVQSSAQSCCSEETPGFEQAEVDKDDVDFSAQQLRQSDWRGKLTTPKNGHVSYVPLTERLFEALRESVIPRATVSKDDGRPLTVHQRVDARLASGAARWCANGTLVHAFLLAGWRSGCARRSDSGLAGHQELSGRGLHALSPDMLG